MVCNCCLSGDRYHACPRVEHVFAFELDKKKRELLLEVQKGLVGHIFGDVLDIAAGKGFDYVTRKTIEIPDVDLLISGPVCADLFLDQQPFLP